MQCDNPACPWWQGAEPRALDTRTWRDRVSANVPKRDH